MQASKTGAQARAPLSPTTTMIGQSFLHYEILEKLGEGGMGVVYKARDTHLDRFVALKVLPPEKVTDPSRKARFVQEAKAASALNHPNIVTVYDIASDAGQDFIAMEYVAGETLDQRIPRKGMRLTEALKIAVQIADALARAHAAGIVHRDLKPSNVMVGERGEVKLLDFGLAKLVEADTSGDATTATMGVKTEEGTVVGTAAYMSPEQAQGRPLDARSDIFSFGAVLYEMLTGCRAFQGTSNVSVLAAVLREEPAPLPADVPYELRKIIERCLRKDPERRLQHMDDVKLALDDLKQESDSGKLSGGGEAISPPKRRRIYVWAAMAAVGVLLLGGGLWRFSRQEHSPQAVRENPFVTEPGHEQYPVFSPDGMTVAFSGFPEVERWGVEALDDTIQLKMIGTDAIQVLKKNAQKPAWSPDGRWLAYLAGRSMGDGEYEICVIPRIGGAERKIASVYQSPLYWARSVSWAPDGKWLFSWDKEGEKPSHLVMVSLDTGEKVRLTNPPEGSVGDSGPTISPDGRALAFTRRRGPGLSDIHLLALDANLKPTGEPRPLKTGVPYANYAVWTPDGKEIVFCSRHMYAATLWRMRSDGSGKATPLPFGGRGAFCPDIARVGHRLVYMKQVWDTNIWRVELDSAGRAARAPERFIASIMPELDGTWSPDGKWIAFASGRSGPWEIWVCEASGANPRQITSLDSTQVMRPCWSPDSQWIAFATNVEGNEEIYVIRASGGKHRRLTSDPANDNNPRWSMDGKWIYFRSNRGGQSRVWKVALEGGEAIAADQETLGDYGPGGEHLYYSAKGSLWRKPSSGGAEEEILSGMRGTGFAVSAKGVYFSVSLPSSPQGPWRQEIAFHDFATGQRTQIADLRRETGSNISYSVSPDGRYLLYMQCDSQGSDLMLVENFR
jgi:serine/threonine protein kinase/WD40 repeat protein